VTGPGVLDAVRDLRDTLGDPLRPGGPLTYGQAVEDDRAARFPAGSLDALHAWGYSDFQVPEAYGGRLRSLEELMELGRTVAGRDPTVAVIANSPLAAAMPVWLAGTPAQRQEVAGAVLAGQRVALGLTEKDHGADLLAGEVTGRRTADGWVLNGAKWLINNVRLARFLCLLVRDPAAQGLRSLSLLLVDLHRLAPDSYTFLPRIDTHGVRGADIAGIRFQEAVVAASACVGTPGRGLDLVARSLLVTRTLVPGLSLGALETATRCSLDFLERRHLYGTTATDIPFVRDELAHALLDLVVGEIVTTSCVRALHLLPEVAPVSSAVAKYVVPHLAETRMRRLSAVFGARYYLREGHWSGIFEKLVRDVRLFGLFDGSEPVVLSALAAQASCLAEEGTDSRRADDLFRSGRDALPPLFGPQSLPVVAEEDPVTAGIPEVCAQLRRRGGPDLGLGGAIDLLETQGRTLLRHAQHSVDPHSEQGQRLARRYARVFAAMCLARTALAEPDHPAGLTGHWLAGGLGTLLKPGLRMPDEAVRLTFAELRRQCADRLPLGWSPRHREAHHDIP
jgi:alkylation response protein AidB-like acyl-CoA dehydrogenase